MMKDTRNLPAYSLDLNREKSYAYRSVDLLCHVCCRGLGFMIFYLSSPNGIMTCMITRDPVRKETDIHSAVQKFIYSG